MYYVPTVTQYEGSKAFQEAREYAAVIIEDAVHASANKFQLKHRLENALNMAPGVPGENWAVSCQNDLGDLIFYCTSNSNYITIHVQGCEDESDKFIDNYIDVYYVGGEGYSGATDTHLVDFLNRIADMVADAQKQGYTEIEAELSFQ